MSSSLTIDAIINTLVSLAALGAKTGRHGSGKAVPVIFLVALLLSLVWPAHAFAAMVGAGAALGVLNFAFGRLHAEAPSEGAG